MSMTEKHAGCHLSAGYEARAALYNICATSWKLYPVMMGLIGNPKNSLDFGDLVLLTILCWRGRV